MKNKREKIVGTVVPTELLNLTAEQALDRLAKKYYGTRFRRWCSLVRRWSVEPRQLVGTVSNWVYRKLFPASPKPASRPIHTVILDPLFDEHYKTRDAARPEVGASQSCLPARSAEAEEVAALAVAQAVIQLDDEEKARRWAQMLAPDPRSVPCPFEEERKKTEAAVDAARRDPEWVKAAEETARQALAVVKAGAARRRKAFTPAPKKRKARKN